uniref:Pleckstrin homology domain-containing family A member 7 n=1 Tax=Cacopsylla melanoneura TaxID=428564 RepID=A0A8D9AHW7_9HEMI
MFTCFWQLMSWLDPPVASPPAVFSMATLKKTPNTVTTQPSSRRRPRLSPSSTPLRSPVVKRHPSAPVTIQGWLHKQGSEGLMLWKKRWFVLSDYILFYYKGFEEEKLLGSILLPSYKISPCSSDDKVFRKFSFKAEHTNMRTYYFAAETRESMIQWMNALSLASILQNNSISWDDNRRLNNNINHSNNQGEDNDSGFHGTYRSSSRSKPNNTDPPYSKGGEYGVGGGDRYSMGGGATPQPLYANAPPKPRRLNDASPDRSPEHEYGTSSARGPSYPPQDYPPSSSSSNDPHSSPYQYPPHRAPGPPFNAERRTPDTYGRSNSNTPAHQHASGGPPQPSVTGKVISSKPKGSEYEELHNIQYRARLEQNGQIPSGQVPTKQAARPYSADFLEYELNNGRPQGGTTQPPHLPNGTVQNRLYFNPPQPAKHFSNQPRRPKSSMEFIDNDFDASFWSEENYARKMRQSAIYVSPPASQRATTPSSKHTLDEVPYPTGDIRDEIRYTASLSRVGAYGGDGGKYFQRSASARLPRTTTPDDEDDMELVSMVNSQTSSRDGSERKREESMKRLLEWKQRMLQSPLTRKSSGSSTRGTSNDLSKYYGAKQTQLLRDNLNKQEKENNMAVDNQEEDEEGGKKTEERLSRVEERAPSRIQDGRRSVNSMSRYNSYSSDDEDRNQEFRESRKRVRRQSQHSVQSKSSERSSSKQPLHSNQPLHNLSNNYDYETSKSSERTSSKQPLHNAYDYETMGSEQVIKPSLSPESKYINSYCYAPTYEPMERRDGNLATLDKSRESHGKNNLMSCSSKYSYKYTIDFNEDKRDLDDRFSKHSDSGYDTLRTPGKMLPPDPEVSDLLKFRFDRSHHDRNNTLAYAVHHEDNRNNSNDNYEDDMEWDFRNEGPADLYEFLKVEASAGNLVQNRIKEFETSPEKNETKDMFELQEPLKLSSSYHSNEAHVSFIKSNESSPDKSNASKKPELNGFAQGDTSEDGSRYTLKRDIKNQNPKSVKDLLADFEKKSQMLKEQSEAEAKIIEESSNRYVFSDTETLLYDTSSDHEIADERILNHVKKPTDPPLSEDDEEVAAALGKQESFFSACRDIGRKSDKLKRKNSKSSIGESSVNTDIAAGYNRLSIAESMVTHDDVESHRSFLREKEPLTLNLNRIEDDNTSIEEHYMPMTPSKKNVLSPSTEMFVVHSRNNSATHSTIMEDLLTTFEESSYVEMTENGLSKSLLAPKNSNAFASKNNVKRNNSLNSSGNYCEIDNKADSHYDLLYKSGSSQHYEPLYMEVSANNNNKKINQEPSKEKPELPASNNTSGNHSRQTSKTSDHFDMGALPPTPPRIILPDILNSSSNSIQKQTSLKSDSSDADDEASKDLDSIDTPRHPRFSLSDTFRPASYYLGASTERTVMEQHDSSDSDLVSPPPIPKSPPPIEDLDMSLDSTNLDSSRLDMTQDSAKRFEKENRQLWNLSSRSSELKTVHEKMEMLMSQPDDTLSSETDSINSLRKSSRHEILMKRRPVSADILNSLRHPDFMSSSLSGRKSVGSDLDSIGSRNGLAVTDSESIDFDQYLEDLQVNHNMDFSNLASKNYEHKNVNNGYSEERTDKMRSNMGSQQSFYSQGSEQSGAYETNKESVTSKERSSRHADEVHYENLNAMYNTNTSPPPLPPSANAMMPPPRPPSYSHTLERRREQQPSRQSLGEQDNETYERLRRDFPAGEKRPGYNTLPVHHRRQDSTVGLYQSRNETVQSYQVNHSAPSTSYGTNAIASSSNQDQRNNQREIVNYNEATANNRPDQRGELHDDNILGAPYYYSDLLKEQEDSLVSDNSASSYPNNSKNYTNPIPRAARNNKLNNQRDNKADILAAAKRNDIGRKVNRFANDMQDMDEATRFAAELKTTSEQFLGTEISTAASKCVEFDEKNLFESDTIQRRKSSLMTNNLNKKQFRSQTPDPLSTRNLYPLGISDKNESYGENEMSSSRRRSRSLEGLLDDSELYADPNERPTRVSPGSAISRLLQTTQPLQHRPSSTLHSTLPLNANLPPSSRAPPPPADQWEEDNLWRESLRRVSMRHTRSLDDLDQREVGTKSGRQSADILSNQKKLTREVTYVNDIVSNRINQQKVQGSDDSVYVRLAQHPDKPGYPVVQQVDNSPSREQSKQGSFLEQGMYPTRPPSFEIDREKLRQWDLMSSAPAGMLLGPKGGQNPTGAAACKPGGSSRSHADNPALPHRPNTPPSSPASGSGSMMDRAGDPLPPRVRRHSTSHTKSSPPGGQGPGVGPHPPVSPTTITNCNSGDVPRASLGSKRGNTWGELSVSAGELLGRTHEELVLLLIQLRRQSAGVCKSMEISHREIETQARLADMDTTKRMEHLQKLEELKRHLLELEKQYEKGKPLVNLVDNMVKLGSLYRAGTPLQANGYNPPPPLLRERLEFNHKVQEQRLLAEERKDWDRLSPNHNQLQAKVEQLYHLDRILQEESGTLQSLQQDKEMLENALGSLRHKMHGVHASPAEVERYRRQQRLLERELSRVRSILAHNSKKLEETVAANARLESELVILRQKLQWSRREVSNGSSTSSGPSVAALEAELRRVQALVGDLQRQRQELSAQVKQLTEKSNSLSQQIRPGPTGVAGAGPVGVKRKSLHGWLETDLDSNATHDIAISPCSSFPSSPQNMNHSPLPPHSMNHSPLPPHSVNHSPLPPSSPTSVPLYVNTDPCTISNSSDVKMNDTMPGLYDGGSSSMDEGNVGDCRLTPASPQPTHPHAQPQYCKPIDISEADDRIKRFYGIIPKDKPQEIKTVRIVKRESERRQRDRGDRSGNIGIPLANGNGSVPLGNTVPLGNLLGNAATARRVTVIEESSAESGNELQHNNAATGRYSSPDADTGLLSKCSSLPRGFGRHVAPPPPPPAPRSDSIAALRNIMARSNIKYKTDHHEGSQTRGLSAREQLFGSSSEVSPATTLSSDSPSSSQVSPVFKSEAAKQIIQEVSNKENNGLAVLKPGHGQKRAIPKEKRRHHTVTSSSSSNPFRYDGLTNISRARDDLDMEVALRPRLNGAPDVVRSTLSRTDPVKFSAETIDSLLGTPGKIVIPERYIPETETLSREEKNKRFHKAEAIRKMLSESNLATCADEEPEVEFERPSTLKKKVMDERKQREHLLQLNQILAQQVMEKSKQVAVRAMASLPASARTSQEQIDKEKEGNDNGDSPPPELPLYQQRENYFS